MIERRNLLELIGKDSRKYHSCIITAYSFDFSFFEQRVLPVLRGAGIKNVNVFIDGNQLESAQEWTSGKEFAHNKAYNFQPIYCKGVFHPKIILLTGKKHGLLFIGSGNITSSGLSTNDEVWGAFRLDHTENENAPLFGDVRQYLNPFLSESFGFARQKIQWMRQYSPWIHELPVSQNWTSLNTLGIEARFLANTGGSSISDQLNSAMPDARLKRLTVVSPYYDQDGAQLHQLIGQFKPDEVKCLVDEDSGLLPYRFVNESSIPVTFHSWNVSRPDFDNEKHRLHAKIFHFGFEDEEYLLLGSANATLAGLGRVGAQAANDEAGILLRRTLGGKDWIEELGISIPKAQVELKAPKTNIIHPDESDRSSQNVKSLYAELSGNELTIFTSQLPSENWSLQLLDRDDLSLEITVIESAQNRIVARVEDPEKAFKVAITVGEQRVSNYSFIHRMEALLRCNPDPAQEKLAEIIDQDFTDGVGLTDLLSFAQIGMDDQPEVKGGIFHNAAPRIRRTEEDKDDKEYEVLDKEEFNKEGEDTWAHHSAELAHPVNTIAEFLSIYSSRVFEKEDDYSESEEQRLLEDEEQQGDGQSTEKTDSKRVPGEKEKKALSRYLKKLDKAYTKKLQSFYKRQPDPNQKKDPISQRELSSILIGVHLVDILMGKKYTEQVFEGEEDIVKEHLYISHGGFDDLPDSVKGMILNVAGKFLLLSGDGYKHDDSKTGRLRFEKDTLGLAVKLIGLAFNCHWRSSEEPTLKVFVLNCLFYLLENRILSEEVQRQLKKKLSEYSRQAHQMSAQFRSSVDDFLSITLPEYIIWYEHYTDKSTGIKELIFPTEDLKRGGVLFKRQIGFNLVLKAEKDPTGYVVNLSRPGYQFQREEFIRRNFQVGGRSVVYEVYDR